MIVELDRYHGVVLRQIMLSHEKRANMGVADLMGRKDAYFFEDGAFQIKHSTKRLSPWQFTYLPENRIELERLRSMCDPVWVFLVCGIDGVVGLSFEELVSIMQPGAGGIAWIRVSRDKHSMYRV